MIDRTPHGLAKSADGRIERRNYGRGHGYKIDGQKAIGVTTVLNGSVPKPALVGWAAGAVAEFVADNPERAIEDIERFGRDGFVKAMKEVPSNDRDKAANRGTEVHSIAERLSIGEEVEVPEELQGHVDAFLDFRARWKPTNEAVEVVCANLEYGFAGTLDSWANLKGLDGISLVDIKTNRSGPFGEVALQLAGYDLCDVYIDGAGTVRNMPKFDHHLVLWLRSDGWDLIPFDVTDVERDTFLYCQQVAYWNDYKTGRSGKVKQSPLPVPKKETQ